MSIVTAEELYDAVLTHPNLRVALHRAVQDFPFVRGTESLTVGTLSLDRIQEWLDGVEGDICSGLFPDWKALRPWEIVDFSERLDPTKPWIGWEVETSWRSEESRTAVMREFMQSYDHVIVDAEGPAFGLEMTWSPANADEREGEHPLEFVVRMAQENEIYYHDSEDSVGTHLNISVPSFRDASDWLRSEVCNALNEALMRLSYEEKERLFGRVYVYGGFVDHESYIEIKSFNTTYSLTQALKYQTTAQRMARLIETLAGEVAEWEHSDATVKEYGIHRTTVDNFYACLVEGDAPVITIREDGEGSVDFISWDDF